MRKGDQPGGRDDVHDRAAPRRGHVRKHGPGAAPRAAQVDVDDDAPGLFVQFVSRHSGRADDAGVVDQHVHGPELLAAAAHGRVDLVLAADVGDRRHGPDAEITASRRRLLEVVSRRERIRAALDVGTDVREQQIGARLGECESGRAPYSAAGAGDARDPGHDG